MDDQRNRDGMEMSEMVGPSSIDARNAIVALRRLATAEREQTAKQPAKAAEIRNRHEQIRRRIISSWNFLWAMTLIGTAMRNGCGTIKIGNLPKEFFGFLWDFDDFRKRIETEASARGINTRFASEGSRACGSVEGSAEVGADRQGEHAGTTTDDVEVGLQDLQEVAAMTRSESANGSQGHGAASKGDVEKWCHEIVTAFNEGKYLHIVETEDGKHDMTPVLSLRRETENRFVIAAAYAEHSEELAPDRENEIVELDWFPDVDAVDRFADTEAVFDLDTDIPVLRQEIEEEYHRRRQERHARSKQFPGPYLLVSADSRDGTFSAFLGDQRESLLGQNNAWAIRDAILQGVMEGMFCHGFITRNNEDDRFIDDTERDILREVEMRLLLAVGDW